MIDLKTSTKTWIPDDRKRYPFIVATQIAENIVDRLNRHEYVGLIDQPSFLTYDADVIGIGRYDRYFVYTWRRK